MMKMMMVVTKALAAAAAGDVYSLHFHYD